MGSTTMPAMIERRPSARVRTRLWGISAIVGAALVLGSCGGQSPSSDAGSTSGDKAEQSPLEPYLGPGGSGLGGGSMRMAVRTGGDEADQEEQRAKQRKVEQEVVACMEEAGFDYVANVPKDDDLGKKFEEAYSLPPGEFAKKYGYGVATMDHLMPDEATGTDPNQKIREKLSPQAQKAYDKALYGSEKMGISASGGGTKTKATTPDRDDLGCYGKAAEKVYGKQKQFDEDAFKKFDSLFKDLDSLRKRMENDQRVKDASKAWADCMADQGYPNFEKPQDAQQSVWDKFSKESEAAAPKPTGDDGGDGGDGPVAKPMPMRLDAEKRREIRELELKLAPIDHECQEKHFAKPAKEVRFELEKEFLAQHKAQLEQYRDTMAEMGVNVTGGVG
jgi:hypothetical protein